MLTHEHPPLESLAPIGTTLAEMAFGAPPQITQALSTAVSEGSFGYLAATDIGRLSSATAEWLREEFQWKVEEAQIRPVGDLVAGFRAVLSHFVPEGQPIIVPTPGYMPFLSLPGAIGRPVIEVPMLRTESGWSYDFAGIRAAFEKGARLFVLCNPHNPIGKVADESELMQVERLVDEYDGIVFADEIHAPILMSERPHVVYAKRSATAAGHTITATSASKAFNIPATKCGQLIFTQPAHLERWMRVGRWHEHQTSLLGVIATEVAYTTCRPWLNAILRETRSTIDAAMTALTPVSERIIRPDATYLLWLDLVDTELEGPRGNTARLARERVGLIATDGLECGGAGAGHIRFNAALPREQVVEAMERLAEVLTRNTTLPLRA